MNTICLSDGNIVVHGADGSVTAPNSIPLERILAEGADMFIEKGALELCQRLWDLNITTVESEAHGGSSYVTLGNLSDENKAVFEKLAMKEQANYRVGSWKFGEDAMSIVGKGNNLSPDLANAFQMQDVTEGFMTPERFLRDKCGCFTYELRDQPALCKVFDKSKMTKSLGEYIKEHGMENLVDKENGRIYESDFYLNRHKKFVEYKKQVQKSRS